MKNISKIFLLLFISSSAYGQDKKGEELNFKAVYPSYDYGKAHLGQLVGDRVVAKRTEPISFDRYDLEGTSYVEVTNCIAGSDVAFYSRKGGGKVIKAVTADKNGKVIFEQPGNFNPAFAVNLTNKNSAGITGNGMVDFASEKLFSLQDVKLAKNVNSQTIINWKLQVNFDNAVVDVQRSSDGNNFKSIGTVAIEKGSSLTNRSYIDDKENNAVYRLVLTNKTTNSSYATKPVQLEPLAGIAKIFPSPTSDNINVTLANGLQGSYIILDNSGKAVKQGKLSQKSSQIAVADLTKGIYFIKITSVDNKTQTKQFIKN